jgi:hypothetical protein
VNRQAVVQGQARMAVVELGGGRNVSLQPRTAMFGVGCLGSLWTRRPLMYGFAVEFIGPDTAKGREMISLWQYEGFRRIFRIITAVWGVGFLLEAALRVVIVYGTSTGTALSLSKVMPYIWVGIFVTWTVAYGRYQGKKGERMMAAAAAAAVEVPGTNDADPQPADITNAADPQPADITNTADPV